MKKTTIRSALAVLLAASTLTACGGSAASSAPASAAASSTAVAPAKQYTIGIAEAQANDETTVRRAYLENYIGPAYNVKFIFSEVLKDDAATKTFIENCADAGADAIIDFKSMSGQMCQICADNDMVYAISGTNKRRMILAIEMDSVLPTTFQNVGRASMSRKFFNPTQGEFLKLRRGVKSWNAMTKPNMGR